MNASHLRTIVAAAGAAIALILLYLAARELSWSTLVDVLGSARWPWVAGAAGCLAAGFCFRMVRWWLMLQAIGARVPLSRTASAFLGSFALNNILPLRAGDAVRVLGFKKTLKVRPSRVAGTLLFERILDFGTLLSMLAIGVFLVGHAALGILGDAFLLAASVGFVLVVVIVFFPRTILHIFRGATHAGRRWMLGVKPARTVRRVAARILISIARIRQSSPLALIALSVLSWGLEAGVLFFALIAIEGAPQFVATVFGTASGNLATLIPSTPGHFGTYHFFAAKALGVVGIEPTEALLAVAIAHLVTWGGVTIAGLIALAAHAQDPKPGLQGLAVEDRSARA